MEYDEVPRKGKNKWNMKLAPRKISFRFLLHEWHPNRTNSSEFILWYRVRF
jgi:hypothetical protein